MINRTSTATAKEPWHLHRERAGATCPMPKCPCPDGVELVEKHPALVTLNAPNPFFTRQELFESGQQHVDLTGEGWLIVSYLGKMPAELWVTRPDRMVVVTSPTDFLLGYIYLSPGGAEVPLKREQVLSQRMPHPMDPYRGLGPVQTIISQIEGSEASAEWNTSFFRNGARPGGIVKLTRRMQDKEFNKLVERWNSNHRGPGNAGRTAFLEDGDYTDIKPLSMADMQFVETANLNRDTILLAYGASKFDVGVLEDVNLATATAARADFAERMTMPRLDRWQGMLNNDYLPLFPGTNLPGQPRLTLVPANPVPSDQVAQRADELNAAVIFDKLVRTGMDAQQAAEIAGLPLPVIMVSAPTTSQQAAERSDGNAAA
ncbi:MAG: phage portal protein [Jiangellaceae bacterium]